jgi:hypothetical protein
VHYVTKQTIFNLGISVVVVATAAAAVFVVVFSEALKHVRHIPRQVFAVHTKSCDRCVTTCLRCSLVTRVASSGQVSVTLLDTPYLNRRFQVTYWHCKHRCVPNRLPTWWATVSVVWPVTRLWDGRSRVRIPTLTGDFFSSPKGPYRFWGPLSPYSVGTVVLFRE